MVFLHFYLEVFIKYFTAENKIPTPPHTLGPFCVHQSLKTEESLRVIGLSRSYLNKND